MMPFSPQNNQSTNGLLPSKYDFIEKILDDRQRQHRLRQVRSIQPLPDGKVRYGDKILLNFSGNDYLGLSQHPEVIDRAKTYLDQYGSGSGSSRLVTGTLEIHQQLEADFAQFLNRESALLLNTGFQGNATVLPTLFDRSSLILCDRLVHNSLLQGIRASQATFIRYRHNNLSHLKQCLETAQSQSYNRIGIVTETLFSMDGDRCDLETIVQLAQDYGAWLYLDDAHAVGVLGTEGRGLAAAYPEVDVTIVTLGKAFGSFGAVVGCRQRLKDYWLNTCPGLIYTTALPPAIVGAAQAALELMPHLEPERLYLQEQAQMLHQHLQFLGYRSPGHPSFSNSNLSYPSLLYSPIVPILLGNPHLSLQIATALEDQGILATAIRSPTVPPGGDRIRLTLSSIHPRQHYQTLQQALNYTASIQC